MPSPAARSSWSCLSPPWAAAALALVCSAALAGPLGSDGGSFTLLARAQLSQLAQDGETQSFSSGASAFAAMPAVEVRHLSFNADIEAAASAFQASTFAVKANHGVNVSTSSASFAGSAILVDASPALSALIPAGQTFLDVLVHFSATVGPGGAGGYTVTPTLPGVSRQSTVQIAAAASTDSLLGRQTVLGRFDAVNGSTFHSFSASGLFAGLPEGSLLDLQVAGGRVDVAVPARISPDVKDGGVIGLGGSVGFLTALASGSGSFANAQARIELSAIGLTLVDGRRLGELGVTTRLLPAPVPEPAAWALYAAGLLGLAALARRRAPRRR